jgi:hypothetical protein
MWTDKLNAARDKERNKHALTQDEQRRAEWAKGYYGPDSPFLVRHYSDVQWLQYDYLVCKLAAELSLKKLTDGAPVQRTPSHSSRRGANAFMRSWRPGSN